MEYHIERRVVAALTTLGLLEYPAGLPMIQLSDGPVVTGIYLFPTDWGPWEGWSIWIEEGASVGKRSKTRDLLPWSESEGGLFNGWLVERISRAAGCSEAYVYYALSSGIWVSQWEPPGGPYRSESLVRALELFASKKEE